MLYPHDIPMTSTYHIPMSLSSLGTPFDVKVGRSHWRPPFGRWWNGARRYRGQRRRHRTMGCCFEGITADWYSVFFGSKIVPTEFWHWHLSFSLSLWFREWHIVTHHNQLCKTLGSPCVGSWSMHKLRSGAFGGKMLGIPDEIGRSWSFIPRSIIIFPLRTT